jgi:transposase
MIQSPVFSVISDVFGVTGRALLQQLMEKGSLDEETIRSLVKGQIKKKIPQLINALQGKLSSRPRG